MMASLVSRDPAVFLQAVARTCALETARGETMVRLKTLKEQQQQQQQHQGISSAATSREHTIAGAAPLPEPAVAAAAATGDIGTSAGTPLNRDTAEATTPTAAAAAGDGATVKPVDRAVSKSASKSSRKLVPGSFVEVVDALLDVVLGYKDVAAQHALHHQQHTSTSGTAAMELDTAPASAEQRVHVAAPAVVQPAIRDSQDIAPLPADLLLRKLNPVVREVEIQSIVLRLLADYCLLYNNTVGLMLKRDSECGPGDVRTPLHHPHHHSAAAAAQHAPAQEGQEGSRSVTTSRSTRHSSVGGSCSSGGGGGTGRSSMPGISASSQGGQDHHKAGAVLKHIMHVQLVDPAPEGLQAGTGVAANASALLQAVCIRSGEGRKRIMQEVVSTLTAGAAQQDKESGASATAGRLDPKLPYLSQPGGPEPVKVRPAGQLAMQTSARHLLVGTVGFYTDP